LTARVRTPLVGLVCVGVILSAPGRAAEAQAFRGESGSGTATQYDMPERLRRQVSPAPSVPWQSPDLSQYANVLKSMESPAIESQRRYELVELIDLAERVNPETRVAWEGARRAAIGVGLVESEYFPVLTLAALGGYQSSAFPAPKDVAPDGFFRANLEQVVPVLSLRWLLLDFGRRGGARDAAKERLLAANLGFNRKHHVTRPPSMISRCARIGGITSSTRASL
jgi:outer membrane protein TolC